MREAAHAPPLPGARSAAPPSTDGRDSPWNFPRDPRGQHRRTGPRRSPALLAPADKTPLTHSPAPIHPGPSQPREGSAFRDSSPPRTRPSRPGASPPHGHAPLRRRPLPPCLPASLLLPALLLCAAAPPLSESSPAACPAEMTCSKPAKGFFSDGPGGYIRVGFTGLGPNQPESCSRLCRSTKGCAFWMYHSIKPDGECKMWSLEQSPCKVLDDKNPQGTLYDPQSVAFTVVGGPCQAAAPTEDRPEGAPVTKSACPRLHCASPHRGFLYDHPEKGHLLSLMTGQPKKPQSCYDQCRETPGCSFWMFNMKSDMGDCVLWNADQNPCNPEPGSQDQSTAHFDPHPTHGSFLVGGYCKIPKPEDAEVLE